MTRIRHNKSGGRVITLTSDRATPAASTPRKRNVSQSGPVTSNKPAEKPPMCCNMVLPKSGECPNCSD